MTAIFAALVFLTGCSGQPNLPPRLSPQGHPVVDVHVYITTAFSQRERDNIVNGILLWERATNGLIIWHLMPYVKGTKLWPVGYRDGVEHRTVLFRKAKSTDAWVKRWETDRDYKKKHQLLLGLCHGDSLKEVAWLWLVEDRLYSSNAETMIAAHEFGHAMGLDHVDDKHSTMSALYKKTNSCITIHDLFEFSEKHNLALSTLNPTCRTR